MSWKILSLAAITLQPLVSVPTVASADVGALEGLHTLVGSAKMPDGSTPGITNIMVTAERKEATPTIPTPMLVLAQGLSTPDGLFGLDVPLSTLATDLAAGNSGTVNVVVTAVAPATADSAYWMSYATPLTLADGSFIPVPPIELSMEQVPLEPSQTASGPQPCGYEAREGLDYQYTDFAELHSWDDMTAKLSNTFNASSTLDVGFSASGSAWKVSGAQRHSEDKGASNTATRSGRHGRVWQQKFEYEKLVAYYPGPDSTPPAYPIDCGSGQIVTRRIRATTPVLGFGEDASPEGDHSSYDGPAQYLRHKSPEKMADFSSQTSAHKHSGVTNRYEAAATVFNTFTLGVVSEYSATLGFDWEFGKQFPDGKSYHLWGETTRPEEARNVAAYSGPEPVVITPPAQTTSSSASWTVKAGQDTTRTTTLKMEYGDGASETRSIPQGSSTSTFTFSHTFSATGTYGQTATIVETGAESVPAATQHVGTLPLPPPPPPPPQPPVPLTLACGNTHTGTPGRVYKLSGNITNCSLNAVNLAGNRYTLDLNGREISCQDGASGDGWGIRIWGTGITIVDSSIAKTGVVRFCDIGVKMYGGDGEGGNTIDGIKIQKNQGDPCSLYDFAGYPGRGGYGEGVVIEESSNNTIRNSIITGNGTMGGISLIGSSRGNQIHANVVSDNQWPVKCTPAGASFYYYEATGIRLEPNADNNVVRDNIVERNGLDGIAVFPHASDNVIANNILTDNGTAVPPAVTGYVYREEREGRKGDGIRLFDTAGSNRIDHNVVCGNQGNGIYAGVGLNFLNDNMSGTLAECAGNDNHKAGTASGYWDLNDFGDPFPPAGPGACVNLWSGNTASHVNKTCTTL
ncbi:MAG TPA: right-handed parallel beta-helix repeat-containing protein [Acidimicrobiales bacterium]|nr:right-handed parallel beta-helix repeat-containing protein [Acidimicrobiales bacterium]